MDTQNGNNYGGGVKEVGNKKRLSCGELGLRFLAFSLTLVAAVVVGIDKQTQIVAVTLVSTLPPLNVPVTAKTNYFSAFVYFVVVNAIACAYAFISLILTLATRGGNKGGLALMITVLDLIMVALLSSGSGAAAAIGIVGLKGNSHVQWKKVCNVFGKFCHQTMAGIVLSVIGSATFLLLVVVASWNLHKKHK